MNTSITPVFKAGFKITGAWWQQPNLNLLAVKKIYLVESIADATALQHLGIAAVAIYTCTNYPAAALNELAAARQKAKLEKPELVWALKGDAAGKLYTKKWVKLAKKQHWQATAAPLASPAKH